YGRVVPTITHYRRRLVLAERTRVTRTLEKTGAHLAAMCCEVHRQHRILLTHIYQQDALTAAYRQCIRDMKGQRVLQVSGRVLNESEPNRFDYMSRAEAPAHARQPLYQNSIDITEQH